jgi:transposase-like protein
VANVLSFSKRVQITRALIEGNSIRSTGRLVNVYKETVMNLGRDVGLACVTLHDRLVRGVEAAYLEVDECWAYVGSHEKHKPPGAPKEWGDAYTFFAIDPESKLVPSYLVGKRTLPVATQFMQDLRERVVGKPQMSVDGWPHWAEAVRRTFGHNGVHLGSIVKEYQKAKANPTERHYRPNRVKEVKKEVIYGKPEQEFINTAIAERLNMTTRMTQRRLTRLTNAFSKKRLHLKAAVALHFMHYNFVREHESLGTTPAVKAGLVKKPWTLEDLVRAALDVARLPGGRGDAL